MPAIPPNWWMHPPAVPVPDTPPAPAPVSTPAQAFSGEVTGQSEWGEPDRKGTGRVRIDGPQGQRLLWNLPAGTMRNLLPKGTKVRVLVEIVE